MSGVLKCPRKHKHLAPVLDLLGRYGASDVRVVQNRHLHVNYVVGEQVMSIAIGVRPKNIEDSIRNACKAVRQLCRSHGVELPA